MIRSTKKHVVRVSNFDEIPRLFFFVGVFVLVLLTVFNISLWVPLFSYPRLRQSPRNSFVGQHEVMRSMKSSMNLLAMRIPDSDPVATSEDEMCEFFSCFLCTLG